MRKDEFNELKIINEDENLNFEFGKTQESESTSYKDNSDRLRDEINDNPTTNGPKSLNENKKKERKDKTKSEKDDSSSGSSGGGASASYGTTIATVAGASMVVVTTLSTLMGVNLFFNAKCKMNRIESATNSIVYELDLADINNDECIIKLENETYSVSNPLIEGSNSGEFVDLTSNTEYTVSVIDVTYDNYVLYEDIVVTKEETPEPQPKDEGSVKVTNLVPWANKVGVRLYLTGNGEDRYDVSIRSDGTELQVYDLTEGKNEFYFTNLKAETSYEVIVRNLSTDTYIYDEFITTIAEDEAFVTLDLVPDLSDGTFEVLVACEYDDELFDNFNLILSDSQDNIKRFELAVTDEYQTITLNDPADENQFNFDDSDGFSYYITYRYDEEEKTTDEQHIVFDTQSTPVKYNITLNPGESSDEPIVISLREGKTYTLPENPFTPPEGYRFKFWKSGRGEYEPGMKIISYLDKDYEFVATFVEETRINSVEIGNEINFAASEHQIPVTVDYVDPEYDLVRLKVTFYNPDPEKAAEDKNISAEFSPYETYFYAYDTADMTLNTNEPINYKIEYLLESVGEYVEYTTGTIAFVDSEGREAHVDSLDFEGMTVNTSSGERVLKWSFTYTDTFEDKFFKRAALYLTPIEGGSSTNVVYSSTMPISGVKMSISSLDYSNLNLVDGVYTYSLCVYDHSDHGIVVYEGIIDMAKEASYVNKFQIYYEYYVVGDKTYLAVQTDISDKTNEYGNLTFYLQSANSNDDPLTFDVEKRSGFQYFDITGFDMSIFDNGMAMYYVTSSILGTEVIPQSVYDSIMQECNSTTTEYVGGYINSNTVYSNNIQFNIGLFRYNSISGQLSNTKLKIYDPNNEADTYLIPFDISNFANGGVNEGVVTVPDDYEYRDELLSLLKTKKVSVSMTFDCYDSMMGTTDTYTRSIIENYYFSVR